MARIKMHIPKEKLPFTLHVRLNAGCKMGCQQHPEYQHPRQTPQLLPLLLLQLLKAPEGKLLA